VQPHDLVWIKAQPAGLPDWARPDWPVVVRRAEPPQPGLIPVGFRGPQRHQRHAGWIDPAQALRVSTPEGLAAVARRTQPRAGWLPCLNALLRVTPLLDVLPRPWGPTGSVGFALATGLSILHAASDLDLRLQADTPLSADECAQLQAIKAQAGCRLDIQIDTGHGGFAFDEWAAGRPRVLLKTARGPWLVQDPWRVPPDEEAA